ncbi:hypothetical protein [Streptomyces flavofungini]|uniref:Secreted protein n=1 Tax=Streptomyces flavofungini TaxID=68200 RepID=A0ABS0X0F2_9ACTN|nr:hypothetical protein [Streptomyces flavofungini]MBJ3806658.1 hypothetical protein [Streptomyces flavofungini]GHC61434.1 hypothetical protein GCM10010349_31270 [Streptomyces flavofungini]
MRRIAPTLGSLVTAGMLAFAAPGSAVAASGTLFLDDTAYENPSGCYPAPASPLRITNRTNEPAAVFALPNCTGLVIAVVESGQKLDSPAGVSVLIR